MDEHGTRTFSRLDLGTGIDRELARIARAADHDEAERATAELRTRHQQLLDEAAAEGLDAHRVDAVFRRCVHRFDVTGDAAFDDYLRVHLRNATRRAADAAAAPQPIGMREGRFLQVRIARLELQDELGREPTVADLADRIGFTTGQVLDAMSVRSAERVRTARLAAHLADDDRRVERLDVAISELDERTRRVLDRVLREGRSRRDVARELGISTFDVSDLERRGRDHLARTAA